GLVRARSWDESFPFFFQAEDGIRDRNVTGVQTCALPISNKLKGERWDSNPRMPEPQSGVLTPSPLSPYMAGIVGIEPTPTVLETVVLPLNYIPIIKKWKGV